MAILFKVFLIMHIIAGAIGLLTGIFNVVRIKGDKQHVLVGKVFFYAMLTASFSALVLSVLHPNYFLFMVGVFTAYMVGTGRRYIYLKMLNNNEQPKPIDRIITYTMMVAGVLFIGIGVFSLVQSNMFGIVFITFGFLGLRFVGQDLKNYRGHSQIRNYWLIAHLQRMTGGFIAALTAFLVVNSKFLPTQIPGVVYWLLPTAIFTPFIIKWSKKFAVQKK